MPITIQPAVLKYRNGQGEFQAADCLKGDPADVIDDEAGVGDTNVTFSADKLTEMNAELLTLINAFGLSVVNGALCVSFEEESV